MEATQAKSGSPRGWLLAGIVLLVASQLSWGVGLLAWIAPVPFLRYLRVTSGWRSRALLVAALMAAWTLATAKIVSAPLPAWFALLGVAFALIQGVGYLGADWLRRRLGDAAALLGFPALMIVLEFAQHRFTGLASWSAAGYTQLDDLPLLQLASLFGLAGVSFLVYAVAAAGELALTAVRDGLPRARPARWLVAALAAVAAAHVYGALRLAQPLAGTSRAAAIGTLGTFTGENLPGPAERARILDDLMASTRAAAAGGARIAVWTEGAALVEPEEEAAFRARVAAEAAADHLHIVAAYVVPRGARFENKYLWARADGSVDHTYWKHHPAPGEPAVVGSAPLTAVDSDFGRLGGALCYDYDFPALAAAHGALGVDLVALPSSDWRGIDPIHTQMAALRAIEQGVSIVRSTRFGLSAGIDPEGRLRAWSSSFDSAQRVLLVDLPRHGIATPYRSIGDVLVYLAIAGLALALATVARRRLQIRRSDRVSI